MMQLMIKDNCMSLDFDLFTHVTPADGVDILIGWGFGYESWGVDAPPTAEDGSSMWLPNATLAVEAAMTDWATVRANITQNHKLSCDNNGADCATDNTTDAGFGVGFGWQASNGSSVNLDLGVTKSLFTNPIGSMTGYSNPFSGEATLSYTF